MCADAVTYLFSVSEKFTDNVLWLKLENSICNLEILRMKIVCLFFVFLEICSCKESCKIKSPVAVNETSVSIDSLISLKIADLKSVADTIVVYSVNHPMQHFIFWKSNEKYYVQSIDKSAKAFPQKT
jgi:hypothetical protein